MANIGRGGYDPTGANAKVAARIAKKKKKNPNDPNLAGYNAQGNVISKPAPQPPPQKPVNKYTGKNPDPYSAMEEAASQNPRVAGYYNDDGSLKDMTTEGQVAALVDTYFADNHALPDPGIIAQIMSSKNGPRNQEQYEAMWGPVMDALEGDENNLLHSGDLFQVEDTREGADRLARAMGITPKYKGSTRDNPTVDTDQQIDWKTAKQHMDLVLHFKTQRNPGVEDLHTITGEYGIFRGQLYDRLARRNLNVKFKKDGKKYDPDFELGVRRYIFGRQLAYAVFGTPEQQAKANKVLQNIRTAGGYGADLLESFGKQAELTGVTPEMWGSGDTAAGILSILQNTNDDTIRSLVYDGFVFGRPMGQSETQARWEFARAFGVNRLPSQQQEFYKRDNDGIGKLMQGLGNAMGKMEEYAGKTPLIGAPLADAAGLFNDATAYLQLPITYLVRGIGTVGNVAGMALHNDMTHKELMAAWSEHGGREGFEKEHPESKQMSGALLFDMSNWKEAWDEGVDPFAMIGEYMDISGDGKAQSAWGEVAQLGSFGYQFYLGAKIGDPIFYGGAKLGAVGTWKGARLAHKAGTMYYRSRPDFFGSAAKGSATLDLLTAGLAGGKELVKDGVNVFKGTKTPFRVVEDADGEAVVVKLTQGEFRDFNGGKWDDLEYDSYKQAWEKQVEKHAKDPKSPVEPASTDAPKTQPQGTWQTPRKPGEFYLQLHNAAKDSLINLVAPFKTVKKAHTDATGKDWDELQAIRQQKGVDDVSNADIDRRLDNGEPLDPMVATFQWDADAGTGQLGLSFQDGIHRLTRAEAKGMDEGPITLILRDAKTNKNLNVAEHPDAVAAATKAMGGRAAKAGEAVTAKPKIPVRKGKARSFIRDEVEWNGRHADDFDPEDTSYTSLDIDGRQEAFVGMSMVDENTVNIGQLIVQSDAAPGTGTNIMENMISKADQDDVTLTLEAQPINLLGARKVMDQADLEDWYRQFGFESIGNHKMVRHPKKPDLSGPQAGAVKLDLLTGVGFFKKTDVPTGKVTIQPYCPPAWLSSNAELLARIDNDYVVARMYGIPGDVDEIKDIVAKIAKEKEPELIKPLLRELEGHGVNIDSGANAVFKAVQWELERKGIGQMGWSRVFTTMTTYGKFHEIEDAADNTFNVGKAIKMGTREGSKYSKKESYAKLQNLSERIWRARNQDKQAVIDELWDYFEDNLGPKGVEELQEFNRQIQHARGKRYTDQLTRRSWMPGEDGKELSLVLDPNIRGKLTEQQKIAYDRYDAAFAAQTKGLEQEIDMMEKVYHQQLGGAPGKHKGVKTKQGVKGGAALTAKRKELADLKRLKTQALHPEVAEARKHIAVLAEKLGANEDDLKKVAMAVTEATRRAQKQANAAEVLARIGARKQPYAKWPKDVRAEWDKAVDDMNEFVSAQPFRMGQSRQHILHRYDPRVTGWFMSGKNVQNFMKADQAVFEPLMRVFKETVMASVAFPIRVNVGDEMIRLIPEGVSARWATAGTTPGGAIGALAKELKMDKTKFSEFEIAFRDSLAGDWETGNPNDWVTLMPDLRDKNYVRALSDDLASWRREPIVQALIADARRGGRGNFPTDIKAIRAYIKKLRDKDDELGASIRQHLEDTLRVKDKWTTVNGKHVLVKDYNTDMFNEWCSAWEDRLQMFAKHETLRKAMMGEVPEADLVKWAEANQGDLWPINAAAKDTMDYSLTTGNPLYLAPQLNVPFHQIYQGATTRMLSGMGRRLKEVVFADKYYKMRNSILEKHPNIDADELHSICSKEAMRHANQAGYSRSTTMFEDMARNMLPFVSAYRQFWAYWLKTAVKHPVSMSVIREQFPEILSDPFALAGGNYQYLTPAVPFWGPSEDGGNKTLLDLAKNQLPSWGFIPLLGARTAIAAFGGSAGDYSGIPTMSGLDVNRAPFKRQAQLLYGFSGLNAGMDGADIFFGDPEKLERAHINAMLQWMKYGNGSTKPTPGIDYPWWADAMMKTLQALPGDVKPEALWNEVLKTTSPINVYYSPEEVRKKMNMQMEFNDLNKKDKMAAAKYRAANPWLNTFLTYYEVSPAEQNKMRHDPKNSDHLKWWQSPYNYDGVGNVLNGSDWVNDAWAYGRDFKDDQQLIAATHNLYTAINGGYFMSGQVSGSKVTAGTPYAGDINKAKAEKVYKKTTEKAMEWARDVAKAMCAKNGWSEGVYEDLMWKFKNPGPVQGDGRRLGWGLWNEWTKQLDVNRYEVDLGFLEKSFQEKFGAHDQLMNTAYQPDGDKLLKAVGLLQWTTKPELARKLQDETPYKADIATSKKDLRKQVLDATTKIAGNRWYYFTSDQVELLTGKRADPRIDAAQVTLKDAWDEWHTEKAGTDAYREGRNAYYKMQEKLLGNLPGGKVLVGGLDDRLEHVSHFTEPQHISIGAGPQADRALEAWDDYKKIRAREIAKGDKADSAKIQEAWMKFANMKNGEKGSSGVEMRELEKGRVKLWHVILEAAHKYRAILKNSYSDYYKAQGNSAESKFGKQYVNAINEFVRKCTKVNPGFAEDIDTYFDGSTNLGGKLLDWYAY